jgi:hypothetical protein
MKRFVEGVARDRGGLFPSHLDDFIGEDNPVRAVDIFVQMLDLRGLGFSTVDPRATGRPRYHPAVLLRLYVYGYLNAIPSRQLQNARPTVLSRAHHSRWHCDDHSDGRSDISKSIAHREVPGAFVIMSAAASAPGSKRRAPATGRSHAALRPLSSAPAVRRFRLP